MRMSFSVTNEVKRSRMYGMDYKVIYDDKLSYSEVSHHPYVNNDVLDWGDSTLSGKI
jgi:hypothetical protein